jgi:deoxyribodipyrimidine photo-lyase
LRARNDYQLVQSKLKDPSRVNAHPNPEDTRPAVVWLRQDLRLNQHPGVALAVQSGRPLLFLYVLDDAAPGRWRLGGASRWWLHHSLAALQADLEDRGAALILRRGPAQSLVPAFARETGAAMLIWARMMEPFAIARDSAIKAVLKADGVQAESVNATLLVEPWALKPASGGAYFKVYSPFWRAAMARGLEGPAAPAPARFKTASHFPPTDNLSDWGLTPTKPDWAGGLKANWTPGEAGARAALQRFVDGALRAYPDDRNRPDRPATSRLSAHLHFGEICPAVCLAAAQASNAPQAAKDKFIAELGWREFSHHLLFHAPDLPERAWKPAFEAMPWRTDSAALQAWRKGRTGYPIVDAGMRELWTTGVMHNRVRMIAASFLIKHLLLDWRAGQDWFWDTLVDADLANNAASWQWVAGSGADAAPYFRIFNPIAQGETYDPEGAYVARFVPELARLPAAYIHKPWMAGPLVLREAGVRLGVDYPLPIVDHAQARARALAALDSLKQRAGAPGE